jgi:hypothetical protein
VLHVAIAVKLMSDMSLLPVSGGLRGLSMLPHLGSSFLHARQLVRLDWIFGLILGSSLRAIMGKHFV